MGLVPGRLLLVASRPQVSPSGRGMVALNTDFVFCIDVEPDDVEAWFVSVVPAFVFLVAGWQSVVCVADGRPAESLFKAGFDPFVKCHCFLPVPQIIT